MRCRNSQMILEVLSQLHMSEVPWILLFSKEYGKHFNCLADLTAVDECIRILVRPNGAKAMHEYLRRQRYELVRHPHKNDMRLYGVGAFKMYRSKNGILIDVSFQISVRSLDQGQWIPLDKVVQDSAWRNSRLQHLGAVPVRVLRNDDLIVSTLSRLIFDKKEISDDHLSHLQQLLKNSNRESVLEKLRLVFFRYADHLLVKVENGECKDIVQDYLQFCNY